MQLKFKPIFCLKKFMSKLLQWDEIYCWQKFLPLLTRWQLFHYTNNNAANVDGSNCIAEPLKGILTPKFIKKKRAPKGVASYEIIWQDEQNCFNDLIPEKQINIFMEQNSNNLQLLWSTVEPEDLVQKAYPNIVDEFLISKIKPKKAKKVATATTTTTDAKPKKPPKPKRVKNIENQPPPTTDNNMLIDRFFKKTKTAGKQSIPPPVNNHQQSPKIQTTTSPINLSNFSIDFDDGDDFDEHDISNAIKSIASRPPEATEIHGYKLRFDEFVDKQISTTSANASLDEIDLMIMKDQPFLQEVSCNASTPITKKLKPQNKNRRNSHKRQSLKSKLLCENLQKQMNNVCCSSFFDAITKANSDVFEKSIDFYNMPDEFDAICTNDNDTFDLANYVPVGAKLRKKLNR